MRLSHSGESIAHKRHSMQATRFTVAVKPRADVTKRPNRAKSVAQHKDQCPLTFLKT